MGTGKFCIQNDIPFAVEQYGYFSHLQHIDLPPGKTTFHRWKNGCGYFAFNKISKFLFLVIP